MKKIASLIFIFVVFFTLATKAQWYGEKCYFTDSTIVSSAKKTVANPGYIIASFRPVRNGSSTSPDIVIDHVNQQGNPSWMDFRAEFKIKDDVVNCSGSTPTYRYNCAGVSIIETGNSGLNEAYAFVGAHNQGIFFATLDPSGNLISSRRFEYSFHSWDHKPCIRESVANPGYYYICGSGSDISYVMMVNSVGAMQWGITFSGSEARDIIESPYNSNEVVVVGKTDCYSAGNPPIGTGSNAFFMRLNSIYGTFIGGSVYSFSLWDCDDWFSSIEIANSTTGGTPGYILGGRSVGPATNPTILPAIHTDQYSQWICKLGPNGGNEIWSTLIQPAFHVNGNLSGTEINRVYERYNPNNAGSYEYYGIGGSNYFYRQNVNGVSPILPNLVVYKLNANGTTSGLSPTEFHFGNSQAPQGIADANSDLTGIENGGSDDGIQAFGTDVAWNGPTMTKAYFNGAVGVNYLTPCGDSIVDIDSIAIGATWIGGFLVTLSSLSSQCAGGSLSPNLTYCSYWGVACDSTSLSFGSNARSTVWVPRTALQPESFLLYPNPVRHSANLSVPPFINEKVSVGIYNTLGQKVQDFNFESNKTDQFVIDFDAMQIEKGFYSVKVKAGIKERTYKIIYSPD